MEIAYIDCPRCKKNFHCDAGLIGCAIPLHCPHCDLYFDQEEVQGRRVLRGTAFSGLSRIDRRTFYLPGDEKKQKGKPGKK